MSLPATQDGYEEAVYRVLLRWEKIFTPGKSHVDADVVDVWLATLVCRRVTFEEFQRAASELQIRARFFPRPAELVDAVEAARVRSRIERHRAALEGLVECTTPEGNLALAPPDRVHGGELLDQTPALPAPERSPDFQRRWDKRKERMLAGLAPKRMPE